MINLKAGNRDMRKPDLNFIILGHDLHKNEVSFIFENFIPNPNTLPLICVRDTIAKSRST
jgi:hypothetical protein